jgi:cytochrome c oxidase assembly factor CtaG
MFVFLAGVLMRQQWYGEAPMSATEREVAKYISQSDYDVWNATRREAHKFRDSKGKHELGLYGLTKG